MSLNLNLSRNLLEIGTIPTIVVQSATSVNTNSSNEIRNGRSTDDEISVDETYDQKKRLSFRRNSVSLPNLENLILQETKDSENEIRSDFSNSEIDISDEEFCNSRNRAPLRNARRKSITISPRMLKPPGDDESDSNSPANSITSINSLASLLREKMQMFPSTLKKKKPKDYKLRAFVVFLFLTIIFLVSLAYVLYRQKLLQRLYFEKIKFNTIKRVIHIHNDEGIAVIEGHLGVTLSSYDTVHACLPQDERPPEDETLCMEWMNRARLYMRMRPVGETVRCYNIHWVALAKDVEPTDCFDVSPATAGHWYGGGQTAESAWPLNNARHDFAPFVTGRVEQHQYGNVLKRYFINSKGAAIIVDEDSPLYLSVNGDTSEDADAIDPDQGRLCLRAKYDDFAYVNRFTRYPHLNYTICIDSNMTRLHSTILDKYVWDGLTSNDKKLIHSLLSEPLWQVTAATKSEFTDANIANYTEDQNELNFLKQGHMLINDYWQKEIGDFTVDMERFADLKQAIVVLHRRGFRVVFSIQSFISTESVNFAEAVRKRLLISERFSDRRIPALTRYKTTPSAGVLDITNPDTIPWLMEKLKRLIEEYKIDAYYLDLGVAYNMPHYYQCVKTLHNPDQYKAKFVDSVWSNDIRVFGVNSAVERPRTPTFVSLPLFESSWDGLRRVIPTILTYGLMGYPLLIPGAVGGDYEPIHHHNYNNASFDHNMVLPDRELYMRWLQLATFLPVIKFTYLPSVYGDAKLLEMTRELTTLRLQTVTPLLITNLETTLETSGIPLVRPLWMMDSADPACHTVADEFSIGSDLVVAPILYSGAREREVYLPAGVWRDGITNRILKGSRWIHDYRVEENQVAHFLKMPDNTRF